MPDHRPPPRFKIATFNLFNLVLPGVPYYRTRCYTHDDYERKSAWIAGQLDRMGAGVVGFQEVFHEAALRQVLARSQGLAEAEVVVAPPARPHEPVPPGDEPELLPRVALASAYPIVEHEVLEEFPEAARLDFGGVDIPLTRFSRPLLRCRLELPNGIQPDVYVIHLKSKRPEVPDGADPHDPVERAKGKVRSLLIRAAEAAALRTLLVQAMTGTERPTIVLGDANDSGDSVTTEILAGTPPWRQMPFEVKKKIWDVLLYDAKQAQGRRGNRDVTYTHIHNGDYESLDHVLVSQEFLHQNRDRLGAVEYVALFNDHLVDSTLSREPLPNWTSDHGQVAVTIRLRDPGYR